MALDTLFMNSETGVLYKLRSDDNFWYIHSAIIHEGKLYLKYEAKYSYTDFTSVRDVLKYHIGNEDD